MTILSFLNISNLDNINCDSGYIFQKQLGLSLIDLGHTFTLVIPCDIQGSLINHKCYDFGSNKFEVRYSFDWKEISKIIDDDNPDIILSNQPELSANIKAIMIAEKIEAKLYTYVHYFPFSLDTNGKIVYDSSLDNENFCRNIILSLISGLIASDKVFVHSDYAIHLLSAVFRVHNLSIAELDLVILPPPYDEYIADTNCSNTIDNCILYNHRLYKQYGTDYLLKFLVTIDNKYDWKLIITDLLYNRNKDRIRLDSTVDNYRHLLSQFSNVEFRNDGNDREVYKAIIESSKLSLAPYRKNCTWSMSVVDCMSAGVPVIAPNLAWYREFIPKDLLFNSMNELIRIARRLINDKGFYNESSILVKHIVVSNKKLVGRESAKTFIESSIKVKVN